MLIHIRLGVLVGAFIVGLLTCCTHLRGEVITDGTTRQPATILAGPRYGVSADFGLRVGKNLVHSFQTFNLNSGETAVFSGPKGVKNVLARVTGRGSSTIAGTVSCTIPNANFYFMNPNGVFFKPGASLDVSGSFVVTTADQIH